MTWSDLIRLSLIEIGAQDPIDPVDPNQQTIALFHLNGILGLWNARGETSYAATFPSNTTTAGLNPHTIGPSSATWSATQRPVLILAAHQLQGSGTGQVRLPINIRDKDWWFSQQTVPNIQSGIVTDLYYDPTYPNGSIYFWPVPSAAVSIQLQVRLLLAAIAEADLGTDIALPFGYEMALWLTLAESLVTPLTLPMPPELRGKASEARAVIFGVNNGPVRIRTRQSGVPGGTRDGASFNWSSRTFTGSGR